MCNPWKRHGNVYIILKLLILTCLVGKNETCSGAEENAKLNAVDRELKEYVDEILSVDSYDVLPGVIIEKLNNKDNSSEEKCETSRKSSYSIQDYFQAKLKRYSDTHVVSVNVPETARFLSGKVSTGKSSFMAGFGMGFLAFALKKLLLPVFIGAQLIKSVLIAMFLPSIIGSLGKLVGKGLSTFSGVSGASTGANNNDHIEDFEFKDTSPYNNDDMGVHQDFNSVEGGGLTAAATDVNANEAAQTGNTNSRFGLVNQRISYISQQSDSYYARKPNKKTDYKVFHKIPTSSMLLTSYDPFYSPLLSRLDAVFQQLGLGNSKLPETERCRERLVCMMYANPAKYAPYSNLVSAQLSRELNELRKPASDNPEILRFFRYMKAAKDGQDGEECLAHGGCPFLTSKQPSPAMLTTFNDINKLVQARKIQ